jgi:hypothetical protein
LPLRTEPGTADRSAEVSLQPGLERSLDHGYDE